jgi:hypothetical protein
MKLYKDILTGDDMFTDVYRITETEFFVKVQGKIVTVKEGDIDDSLIGGNKSAEDDTPDASNDQGSKTGCNIVLQNRLVEIPYSKKSEMLTELKPYLKKLKEFLKESGADDDKLKEFEATSKTFVLDIKANWDDYQFFAGETDTGDDPHCVVFMNYPEKDLSGADQDGSSPVLTFFKAGLRTEKL